MKWTLNPKQNQIKTKQKPYTLTLYSYNFWRKKTVARTIHVASLYKDQKEQHFFQSPVPFFLTQGLK